MPLPTFEQCSGPLITESYWQRGFNHGYSGARHTPPNNNGGWDIEVRGYTNGYDAGHTKRFSEEQRRRAENRVARAAKVILSHHNEGARPDQIALDELRAALKEL